jgi:hypothetical protein
MIRYVDDECEGKVNKSMPYLVGQDLQEKTIGRQ